MNHLAEMTGNIHSIVGFAQILVILATYKLHKNVEKKKT